MPIMSIAWVLLWLVTISLSPDCWGKDQSTHEPIEQKVGHIKHTNLVEAFTANNLEPGEIQLGTEINYGLSKDLMIGTDTIGTFVGIPTLYTKYKVYENPKHTLGFSAQAIWLQLDALVEWSRAKSHYKNLDAKLIRPGIVWTQHLSPRLKIHTYWTQGFGHIDAELSDEGRRKSWEQKHPGEEFEDSDNQQEPINDSDETEISTNENQEKAKEKTSNISRRTLELQSLFGLSTDRFQITGEITRKKGNKIILTSRIEKMHLEKLKANSIRFTIAQQWHHSSFHFRLGIGLMYLTITGTDLDLEKVDETGVLPVTDFSFYWRF